MYVDVQFNVSLDYSKIIENIWEHLTFNIDNYTRKTFKNYSKLGMGFMASQASFKVNSMKPFLPFTQLKVSS